VRGVESRLSCKPAMVLVGRVPPSTLPPSSHMRYYESQGLERSLATATLDRPTMINVNSLRMQRSENVFCPGYVEGVGSYDARVLTGNWFEERCDKAYKPSAGKMPKMGLRSMYQTEYMRQTERAAYNSMPPPGSNSLNPYTHPESELYNGVIQASAASNRENFKAVFEPGLGYEYGDPRSAQSSPRNNINYQAGKQNSISTIGGRKMSMAAYESTSRSAFVDPSTRSVHEGTARCDVGKATFQLRDPSFNTKSKLLCTIKSEEFGCDRTDDEYMKGHILGYPVPGKQKAYTLEEYRNRWTKNAPEIKAAGIVPCSEHRAAFAKPSQDRMEPVLARPGHTGSWH